MICGIPGLPLAMFVSAENADVRLHWCKSCTAGVSTSSQQNQG
jgi:hypothetical protein